MEPLFKRNAKIKAASLCKIGNFPARYSRYTNRRSPFDPACNGIWKIVSRPAHPYMRVENDHRTASQSSAGSTGEIMSPIIRVPAKSGEGFRFLDRGVGWFSHGITITSTRFFQNISGRAKSKLRSCTCSIIRSACINFSFRDNRAVKAVNLVFYSSNVERGIFLVTTLRVVMQWVAISNSAPGPSW